jgi:hypothetical protein
VAEKCLQLDALRPFGHACQSYYDPSGNPAEDPNMAAVTATGPKVAAVVAGIHQRAGGAPRARGRVSRRPDDRRQQLLAVRHPVLGRHPLLNHLESLLNAAVSSAASGNPATFVDTFTSSIVHDVCKPPRVAWVNGVIPPSPAYPLHPNQAGEQNVAKQVLAAPG